MRQGFKTIVMLLKEDLKLERNAVETYSGFVERVEDVRMKKMFQSLADDEIGHAAGLTAMLNKLKAGKSEVKFYCPRCGRSLSFGKGSYLEDEVKCPICNNIFRLIEKNGDYLLAEIKK